MTVFREVPIGEVASVRSGYSFKSADWQKSGVPVVKIANVKSGRLEMDDCSYVSEEVAAQASEHQLNFGDILIGMTGFVGEIARVRTRSPLVLNQRVGRFTLRSAQRIDGTFFFFALQIPSIRKNFELVAYGAAQPNISPTLIEKQLIPLPPLPTQRKIAAILSAYDELIENNLRRIRILEEMAQALYREWFVEFRFPGHERTRFVDSPLGRIPEGWEVRELFEVADVTYGFPFKSELFSAERVGPPVVRIRDIPDGESATFTSEAAEKRYFINDGDILVGMDGDFHMAIWAAGHALQNQRVARFIPKGGLGRQLLFLLLRAPIENFNATITGTTVAHLGDKHIRTIRFAVPTPALLAAASEALDPPCELGITLKKRNALLRRTRDLLLPRLISGELDVSDLDIAGVEGAA